MCQIQLISTATSDNNSSSNTFLERILKTLPCKFRTEIQLPRITTSYLFKLVLQALTNAIRQEKICRRISLGKEGRNLSLCTYTI